MSSKQVQSPAPAAALDPEHLTAEQIKAIVHLKIRPPASVRNLTYERQLIYLVKQQNQAIAALEADPKIEERAVPRRDADGDLVRDPITHRIQYDVERVPVAEREVERLEGEIQKIRDTYAATLKVGPEARAERQDAEHRYLAQQFGSKDEQAAVPVEARAAAIANFRRVKGWN